MLDVGAGARSLESPSFLDLLDEVAARAASLDEDGAFPCEDVAQLAASGVLAAPFAIDEEGGPPGCDELMQALRLIGHASLPLGRLFEGHANAAALIRRYGTPEQRHRAWSEARAGALFGIWNTEAAGGVRLIAADGLWRLAGRKTFASGAGYVDRPLITARTGDGDVVLVLPQLDTLARADLSAWKAHGMRASATGSFDLSGLTLMPDDIVGGPGDYSRQPHFSAGAWRFCAVQLGAIERLLDEARGSLVERGRQADPHQLARMGEAVIAAETARLWVERAARLAEAEDAVDTAEVVVAYVNLARCAVERAGLDVMQLVQRSIGLSAFLRAHAVERLCRDLATYLRQPNPDKALCDGAAYVFADPRPLQELWR